MSDDGEVGPPVDHQSADRPKIAAEPPVEAELLEPRPARGLLLWPSIVITLGAIGGNVVLSIGALGTAAVMHFGVTSMPPPAELQEWITNLPTTIGGLMLFILPGQAGFLLGAVAGTVFSREPVAARLGLARGTLPVWSWVLFAVATPVVGLMTSIVLSQLISEPSPQLKVMEEMFRSHIGSHLPLLVVLICVLPGICEELLFRGMLQRRLLVRFPASVAIAISTVLFAAAHFDPIHVLGVAPLGVWLGILAWRTGSIWPAVLCHMANNMVSLVAVKFNTPGETIAPETALQVAALLGLSGMAFVASVVLLVLVPHRAPASDSALVEIAGGGDGGNGPAARPPGSYGQP